MEGYPKTTQGQFTVQFLDRNTGIVLDSNFQYRQTDSTQSSYSIHNSLKKAIKFAENTKKTTSSPDSINVGYYIRNHRQDVVLHTDNSNLAKNSDLKSLVIDGKNFQNIEEFYNEIDNVLTSELNWKTGHNLNAFNDLLRGGFGVHEYEENIELIWKNAEKSKQRFTERTFEKITYAEIVSIIREHENIRFIEK